MVQTPSRDLRAHTHTPVSLGKLGEVPLEVEKAKRRAGLSPPVPQVCAGVGWDTPLQLCFSISEAHTLQVNTQTSTRVQGAKNQDASTSPSFTLCMRSPHSTPHTPRTQWPRGHGHSIPCRDIT